MISSAFKGAVQSEVQSQGQAVGTAFQAPKEFGSFALSMIGMSGASKLMGAQGAAKQPQSIGAEAVEAIINEKRYSTQQLNTAFSSVLSTTEGKDDALALTTVYEKLIKSAREREQATKLMDELKRGEEE